ncbi:glycoside hydrolase family 32 protein [Spiroplasma tabanidicola]|uniref:beta-fructofuranosidase n=1 Tax=Spiroplasma tabanidicola TaxID=324079 RepID=A0A6I6C977_9MOLU|nr:GH32 C-terminal domain-containing protein [Spiroplasma tabanidicola]QGS52156.1 beta-fructofuranosidase [Spiroplasma tabanidicola]
MKKIAELKWKKFNEIDQKYYDQANKLVEKDKYYRPLYHIASPNGLVNDPNGLLFKDGVHHIHYQWTPVQPYHGFKHWRYVTTKDFVNYKDMGVSVVPDFEKEAYGAFSGSAYDFGNTVKIYYTGNMEDGKGNMNEEVQIVADFENNKVVNKRVAVSWDKDKFTPHARDPKIFELNNKKYMIFGVQTKDEVKGGLAVYEMKDYDKFEFKTVLKPSIKDQTYGYMWECPNLDKIKDRYLFFISAEGYFNDDNKYELNCSRNVVYSVIENLNFESNKLNEKFPLLQVDYGYDFYAPQTYWKEDTLVWFGWFGCCDVQYPTDEYSWHSMLTIPRELTLEGDVLIQKPFGDFKKNVLENKVVKKTNVVEINKAKHIQFNLKGNTSFKILNDNNEFLEVVFDDNEISMDRSKQGQKVDWDYESKRYAIRKIKDKNQVVEMFIDSSSIELFADDYKTVFSSRFFIKDFNRIEFSSDQELEISDIKKMNYN